MTYVGGDWKASRFGGETFRRGLKPQDFAIPEDASGAPVTPVDR